MCQQTRHRGFVMSSSGCSLHRYSKRRYARRMGSLHSCTPLLCLGSLVSPALRYCISRDGRFDALDGSARERILQNKLSWPLRRIPDDNPLLFVDQGYSYLAQPSGKSPSMRTGMLPNLLCGPQPAEVHQIREIRIYCGCLLYTSPSPRD